MKHERERKKSIWVTNKTGADYAHNDWQDYLAMSTFPIACLGFVAFIVYVIFFA